jgi:hypothetical protein
MKDGFIKISIIVLILTSCGERKEDTVSNKESKFSELNYDEQISLIKKTLQKIQSYLSTKSL